MSLTTCIKKAGAALHADDKAAVMSGARKYRADGMSADDAGRAAIRDQLAAVKALLKESMGPAANDVAAAPPAREKLVAAVQRARDARDPVPATAEPAKPEDKTRAEATNGGVQFPWLVQPPRGSEGSVIGPDNVEGSVDPGATDTEAATPADKVRSDASDGVRAKIDTVTNRKDVVGESQGERSAGDITERAPKNVDESTGLPLNDDGTVTVYHHTSAAQAEAIRKTGRLKAAAEPDVYVTSHAETDTGYGDTAVAINVDPAQLQIDDEFPDGRRDFRLSVGKPGGSIKVTVSNERATSGRTDDAGSVALFSRAGEATDEQNALRALSENDDLFALPRSDKTTVEGIAADIDPEIKVTKRNIPGETRYDLTMPDGNNVRLMVRKPSPYGPTLYGFNQVDGELTDRIEERPGENPEDVDPGTEDVFIDASLLTSGTFGSSAYQIAATYAHNTGRIFIGDPAGLSDEALRRRSEQMLSSALKFGTTEHLAPHPRQVQGDAKLGVPPLKWVYGDDLGNIRRLVDLNLKSLENAFPDLKKIDFDVSTGQFVNAADGRPISRLALEHRVRALRSRDSGFARMGGAGGTSIARGAVLRALLREEGRAGEAGGRRDGLLVQIARLASDAGATTKGIFYSRSSLASERRASARKAEVAQLVQKITSQWANAPDVAVVGDMSDPSIPSAVRAEDSRQQSQGASGNPEGFFHGGKVYLVASELGGDADVVRVLFHEALGHAGLRGVFGKDLRGILDRLSLVNETKVRAKAKQYGLDFDKPADRRAAAEEVLAELAQAKPENGFVQSAIAAIRSFLRDHVPGFARMRMSDAEIIRNFILPASRHVEAGEGLPGGSGAAFSRSSGAVATPETQNTLAEIKAKSPWLDTLGRAQFAPGAWAYSKVAPFVNERILTPLKLNTMPPQLRTQVRAMKLQIQASKDVAVRVAGEGFKLSEADRSLVSDIIEGELAAGTVPPEHAMRMAAGINAIMDQQTNDLVSLGMLSSESAERWRGSYLPRFYKSKLMQTLREGGADLWATALRKSARKPAVMQGMKGDSLKGRGKWQTVPVGELTNWEALGWEVRDPEYEAGTSTDVQVWRDYSREEREAMGEIRDAGFRFTMGYLRTQRDIAMGRMFAGIAADRSLSAREGRQPADWVQVPDGSIPGTGGVKRYGRLSGMYVAPEVMNHLENHDQGISDALRMYRKVLGAWKEGKTVLNPVSHANNVMGNLSMAHFAGVSYWEAHKYAGAINDLVRNAPMVGEARSAGLFLGTMSQEELLTTMPPELRAMAAMQASKTEAAAGWVWNALALWLRKPAGIAYEAEDQFFRYLIYRDARGRGLEPSDAVDYSQRYIFTYDDLPKNAQRIRDFAVPFFSYTYKAVPALLHTATHYPHRFLAPAGVMWALNAAMYALAAGEDDEDWTAKLLAYINDPERRKHADAIESNERENLPPWMKGSSSVLGSPKAVRLGLDDATGLPLFWDIAQIMPGGNLFDVENNAGGIGWPQSMMPSHPMLTATAAMFWNKDTFFGKDIVNANDTSGEAAEKRASWLWKQLTPAIAIGNYHTERLANVVAQITGEPVAWFPRDATGVGKDGLPIQPKVAAMQTVGIKVRPIDIDMSEQISRGQREKMVRDIEAEIRRINRLSLKGAISDRNADAEMELQRTKKDRLRDGLTVDGDKPK